MESTNDKKIELANDLSVAMFKAQQAVLDAYIAKHGGNEELLQDAMVGAAVCYLSVVMSVCKVKDPEDVMRKAMYAQGVAREVIYAERKAAKDGAN